MQVKLETVALQEGLRVIRRLAAPDNGTVTLKADGQKLRLLSQGEINQCQIIVPAEVSGNADFAVMLDSLDQAVKGRETLVLRYRNSALSIRGKSYSADLPTTDPIDLEGTSLEQPKKIKINGDQALWLKQAVNAASLKATLLVAPFMPLGVILSKKGAFVTCFDTNHMSWISSKEIQGEAQFCVPADLLAGVLDAFGGQSFVLYVSPNAIEVRNKVAQVRLNLPELDEQGPSLDAVHAKAQEIRGATGKQLTIPKADLLAFLDNSRAVALKERGEIEVQSGSGKIQLSVSTVNGVVKAALPIKAPSTEFRIDYEYFDEMVRKSADPVNLLAAGSFLVCDSSKATVVASFNKS